MKNFTRMFGDLLKKKGLLVLISIICGIGNTYATNYYIAPSGTGNDANNGTAIGTPKLTLASIFSTYNLGTGDVINIAAGTYSETAITVGSDDEGFTIQGAALDGSGNPTSIFDGNDVNNFMLINNAANDDIIINNLKITDYRVNSTTLAGGLSVIGGVSNLQINNCHFDDLDAYKTAGSPPNGGAFVCNSGTAAMSVTFTKCIFSNCNLAGAASGAAIGVDIAYDVDVIIDKCKFYNNSTSIDYIGNACTGYGSCFYGGTSLGSGSTLTMKNSLLYDNSTYRLGQVHIADRSGSVASYMASTIINCTIYNNTSSVVNTNSECGGLVLSGTSSIKNCIIYGNTATDSKDITKLTGTSTVTNCVYGVVGSGITPSSSSTSNPNLNSPSTDNYNLTSSSTNCINTGTSSGAPSDDITSTARVGNPDIGAYEYICPTNYSGTYEVGSTGTWPTLTAAIAALKICMTDDVILELQSTYDATGETFPINFTGLPTSASVTLTVRPKTGVTETITSANTTGTILLDGADYIYFNGSPGGVNSMSNANNLTISNSSTSGYVFKFINDATYNKIEYCNIRGVNTSTSNGSIWFSTGAVSGTGNEYNQINYCEIYDGASTPTNAIYSLGDATVNNNITVNGNYIYNYFSASAIHSGILLSDYNTDWSITNNRFYQTVARDITAAGAYHRIINVTNTSSAGNNITITGNTIGGSASDNTGTYDFTGQGSATAGNFSAIYLNVGTTTASTISNNTIKNLALKDIYTTASVGFEGAFNGIAVLAGKVDIGSSGNGNTIGSTSAANSITYYSGSTDTPIYGIYVKSTSTVSIAYNNIGGFSTSASSGNAIAYQLAGIYNYSTGIITISNNTIGSTSLANSMVCGKTTSTGSNLLYGIYNNGAAGINYTSNIIQNLTNYTTSGSAVLYGIYNASGATSTSFTSNTITTLKMMYDNSTNGSNTTAITCGIYTNSPVSTTLTSNTISSITCKHGLFKGLNLASTSTHTVNSNTILDITVSTDGATSVNGVYNATTGTYNMKSNNIENLISTSNSAHSTIIAGIYFNAVNTSSTIEKNSMSGYSCTQTNTPIIYGIYSSTSGAVLIYNNLFICSNGVNTNNCKIFGVYDAGATVSTLYYNTISISGSSSSGADVLSSACFAHNNATLGKVTAVKNNIFQNSRTGSTNRHYSFYLLDADNAVNSAGNINYNYYAAADDNNFAFATAAKTSSTFNASTRGYGGINSKYFSSGAGNNSSVISVNSDGSLSSGHLAVVTTGADLDATSGCETDIYYVVRNTSGGYKGCYEGPCLIVTSNPSAGSICVGSSYLPSIQVRNVSSISTLFTYQMEFSTDGNSFASVANGMPANSTYTNGYATYTPVTSNTDAPPHTSTVAGNIAVGSAYYYRYLITASTGCAIYTTNAQLTISASNSISSQSTATQTVCPGVSFSSIGVSASGANLTYQWYSNSSASNTGGTIINSETNSSYTPASNVFGSKYYYCVVSGTCGANVASTVSGAMIITTTYSSALTSSDTYIWNGITTNWKTATNWLYYTNSVGTFAVASASPSSSDNTKNVVIPSTGGCVTNLPTLTSTSSTDSTDFKDLTIENGATLTVDANSGMSVHGNFINNGTFSANASSYVSFEGINTQTISGNSTTFAKFIVKNNNAISLGVNTTVSGVLSLLYGNLNLENYNLILSGSSSGGASNSYINTNGTGSLVKSVSSTSVPYSFPIGQGSYSPFTLNFTTGTFTNATITASTKPLKIPGLNSANTFHLNRYWNIEPSGIDINPINLNYSVILNYVDGDISTIGTESELKPLKVSSSVWYKPTGSSFTGGTEIGNSTIDVGNNTLTWSGLTSFSSFGAAGNQAIALPIEIISFTGKKNGSVNELKWITASENINNYFTLEKTTDGIIFDVLGVVNGAGTSNMILDYQFIDYNVSKLINYYRLKQTDFDGVSKYTGLISIDNRSSKVEKQIVTITNIVGQEINENFRGLVIIIYTDGSSEKVIR